MNQDRLNEIVIDAFEQCHHRLNVPEPLPDFINAHRDDVVTTVKDRLSSLQSMLDFIANTPQPKTAYEIRVYGVAHWIMCGIIRDQGGTSILNAISKLEEKRGK